MKNSLRFKMIAIFSTIVLLTCISFAYLSYISSVKLAKDSLAHLAGNISVQAAKTIDLNKYQKEILIQDGETDYYKELRTELNDIREKTGLTYLYTMGREQTGNGFKYFYMVDGMPLDDQEASQLGDEEDANTYPNIVSAFETGEMQIEVSDTEEYGALITTYLPLKTSSGDVIGILGADLDATEFYALMDSYKKKMVISTLVVLLISFIVVYGFSLYLVNPIKYLTNQVSKVGEGDLSIHLRSRRTDEIGTLTNSIQKMMDDLKQIIQGINLNSIELVNASSQLFAGANEVKEGNHQIAVTMNELSNGAESQAGSANQVSQTMQLFTRQIQEASGQGMELNVASGKVLNLTNNGFHLMSESEQQFRLIYLGVKESIEKVKGLDLRSKEISQLIQVIQDIANQTNLLALNAAIEAARAGEHGRGFAVVADEVRKLAEQVTGSIGHIVEIVQGVQKESNETVDALQHSYAQVAEGTEKIKITRDTFNEINTSILSIQGQIKNISYRLNEIFKQSEEINESLESVAAIAEESSAGMEETSASVQQSASVMESIVKASNSVSKLAEQLNRSVEHFKLVEDEDRAHGFRG
ncbi:methyl-accepting chemotaxis protein [Ammoniphilus resinae]|uniref:Methyl-accepting chemotaxis protein n=1 Tax=Ammoniphilus resinae TaxID=861532 RepID=A0ABS4GIP5_9BACL|nr:HAMP domain-containing methyl-accepting chemotaxis protein [Ammoniphilus resinae]MBP1930128.1 methyl-accepting chemotaxis protein [Ammoniphilus resinae]